MNITTPTLTLLGLIAFPAAWGEPSGTLNDTGQIRCLNTAGTKLETCNSTNSGDSSPYPSQDSRFGRDPASGNPEQSGFTKPLGSGGSTAFAFTPLDVDGNAIPLTGNPPIPSATPRCIFDNVTNLIWEVKTDDGGLQDKDWTYGWGAYNTGGCFANQIPAGCGSNNYITALNADSICPVGGAGDWRLPTRGELLSIVDHDRSSAPVIDAAFFPNTMNSYYWSSDLYPVYEGYAWSISFSTGTNNPDNLDYNKNRLRLVRSGP